MRCYVSLVENRTRGCHIGVSVLWKELIIEVPDVRLTGKIPLNDLGQWLGNCSLQATFTAPCFCK